MNILKIDNLTKQYGKETAVNDVSFTLQANTCVALIGPNGAGKTTTLRMLCDLIKQTSGTIHFKENVVDHRDLIGYLPQHPVFYNWMTGIEYLVFCAKLTKLPQDEANNRAVELLERVGISDAKDKRIATYSGGMKQRLGIAQAIIHQPKLLILDEPVSALDPIGRRDVLTLMEELKDEMTILFSTHILSDAEEVSDELLLLHHGSLIESGQIDLLRQKYQTAMIELNFESDPTQYEAALLALPSINEVIIKRNQLHVAVSDMKQARQEIIHLINEHHWPITHFAINRASMEDMFMKAVNS